MPPHGYADHPQDERSHHTFTRTDERFDLWRIIIIIIPGVSTAAWNPEYEGRLPSYHINLIVSFTLSFSADGASVQILNHVV